MRVKILLIPVLLLTLAFVTLPVMGAPATKIEGVTATIDMDATWETRLVDHGILHLRGTFPGEVTLNIPGKDPLTGTAYVDAIGKIKFDKPDPPFPEAEGLFRGKMVWTFTGENTTGTFEGVRHNKWIGYPRPFTSFWDNHMVLRGTGDFAGQTLKLSYMGPSPLALEGTLIIPK
jgi:hypothetical protein